jgi:hypothetical protein
VKRQGVPFRSIPPSHLSRCLLCPSCAQKRILLLGGYLSEDLPLRLPRGQFVWTIPKRLRVFLRHDRDLFADIGRLLTRARQLVPPTGSGSLRTPRCPDGSGGQRAIPQESLRTTAGQGPRAGGHGMSPVRIQDVGDRRHPRSSPDPQDHRLPGPPRPVARPRRDDRTLRYDSRAGGGIGRYCSGGGDHAQRSAVAVNTR